MREDGCVPYVAPVCATMTDKPKRPAMTKKRRMMIWERDLGVCYLCGLKVMAGEAWDVEHISPWEISRDDSDGNLAVAHRSGCHAEKTKADRKVIAKTQRMAGERGQQARRAAGKTKPIPSKPFPKSQKSNWPKRSFPKRGE